MNFFSIIFMLFCTLKAIFYGVYEFKENKNKSGGIAVISTAILGFIIGTILIVI